MLTENLVLAALKEKAPALHKELAAAGTLQAFVKERADEINEQIVSMVMQDRLRNKWDRLPPMELVAAMKGSESLAKEIVYAEMLEFPPEETQDEQP